MEVGQIDFPDVWCDSKVTLRPKNIPHVRLPTDRLIPNILTEGTLIGSGRFGRVYRMLERKSKQSVAVKLLRRYVPGNTSASRVVRKVIEREISILRLCDHPNIIQILQTIETPENVYLVLELCDKSLQEIVSHQVSVGEPEMRTIVRAISDALTYLHSHEFAHRDLKLSNILCSRSPSNWRDPYGVIKLSDFGLGACRGPPGTTKLFTCSCGTPIFMAPEILMKDPYDSKCDVWSLGVVTYCCLVGQEPYPGSSEVEVKRSILGSEIILDGPHWDKLSEGAQSLIKRMLVVDPLSRLTAIEVYEDNWTQGGQLASNRLRQGRRQKSSSTVVAKVKKCLDDLLTERKAVPMKNDPTKPEY